ncbi:MAG: hypothetical protein ACREEM_16550 [Blastocatellia bacterium]
MAEEVSSKTDFLAVLTLVLILGLVATVILLLVSAGFGYALRWLLPSLNLGQAILIGMVAFIAAIHAVFSIINKMIEDKTSAEPVLEIDEDELEEFLDRYPLPQRRRKRRRMH